MKMRTIVLFGLLWCALSVVPVCSFAEEVQTPPKEWISFLEALKKEMLSKGISEKTIQKAYGTQQYYHKRPDVVEKDNTQAEFILTSPTYLNKLVSEHRVREARKKYKNLKKTYTRLEEQYQVPLSYLTAFWAVETNFGQNKGKYHLIDGLTNLSYQNRRAAFFKNELYHVLKIMDKYELENEKMLGSWAGAMGHFQFMPSTYNAYAIDYDGDNVADIWDSFDDAIASAANYLHSLGWRQNEPWGFKVSLPWNFDYQQTGYKVKKTVKDWQKLGVKNADGKKITVDPALKASIIIPDGQRGEIYMVFSNFKRILIWNRSENYALAIGLLSDYIRSNDKYRPINIQRQYRLTDQDIKLIQTFANKQLHTGLKEDGRLGPKTKDAVRRLQMKAKLAADGYPDYRLLHKIKNFDPTLGFLVPVQPQKALKSTQKTLETAHK